MGTPRHPGDMFGRIGEPLCIPWLIGIAIALVFLAPIALYLQWALPGDGPYEYLVTALSLPLIVLSAAIGLWRKISRRPRQLIVVTLLSFFVLLQVWIYVPQISRRVAQWHGLRTMLRNKSVEVEDAVRQLKIPAGRPITREERARLEDRFFTPKPEFDFYFPQKKVTLRILLSRPPYVGVDYGTGRNCIFNLDSMVATYCD